MELEALKQLLASLNISPDEIKDERYATAFRIRFATIEKQNEEDTKRITFLTFCFLN